MRGVTSHSASAPVRIDREGWLINCILRFTQLPSEIDDDTEPRWMPFFGWLVCRVGGDELLKLIEFIIREARPVRCIFCILAFFWFAHFQLVLTRFWCFYGWSGKMTRVTLVRVDMGLSWRVADRHTWWLYCDYIIIIWRSTFKVSCLTQRNKFFFTKYFVTKVHSLKYIFFPQFK